ncbi:MAG: hypothetical protein F4Z31_07730 [Gemmatimonadetes bacterium]|nr:hypothetical protein [Gemmatimonadota bacterium]
MARAGPLPKPNSTRVNQHSSRQNLVIRAEGEVKIPPADSTWHKRAKAWYWSLKKGGTCALYEPEDWEAARIIAEFLSDELKLDAADRKGARLKNYFDLIKQLFATPDARQRARIEIQRVIEAPDDPGDDTPNTPTKIEKIRQRLSG